MKRTIKDFIFGQLKYGYLFKKRLQLIRSYHDLRPSVLLELENKVLISHIKTAYHKSSFYKNLYDKYGVNLSQVQNKDDLTKLPTINKEIVKNHVENIYIGNALKHTAHTSGTSGSPLKVYYSLDCILNEASYNEIFRNNAGYSHKMPVLSFRGVLDGKTKEHYDRHNNILYLSSYLLKPANAKWFHKKINDFHPHCILAYPSALERLAVILNEQKLEVQIPLAFTSSEILYQHQQDKIEQILNTKIYDRYGNAERTISLIQKKHRGPYDQPVLYAVNEFMENGVLTTNLINPQFPLIRYFVGDTFDFDKSGEIKGVGGRSDDFILDLEGLKIGSAAMSLAFKKVPNLLFSQIIQNELQGIIVNLVVNKEFSHQNEQFLIRELRNRIGSSLFIKINLISEKEIITSGNNNKYKLIINQLPPDILPKTQHFRIR